MGLSLMNMPGLFSSVYTAHIACMTTAIQTPENRLSQWEVTRKMCNKNCDKACSTDLKL
jgi:hypothetical protein